MVMAVTNHVLQDIHQFIVMDMFKDMIIHDMVIDQLASSPVSTSRSESESKSQSFATANHQHKEMRENITTKILM